MVDRTQGGFYISKIKQIQGRAFERLLDENSISEFNGAQGRILYVLWQQDGIPISMLAERTGLAKTTLTSMLDRLERMDIVRRVKGTQDRRMIVIELTDKARALEQKYNAVSAQMNEIFYKGFSDQEIIAFEMFLERIIVNLNLND